MKVNVLPPLQARISFPDFRLSLFLALWMTTFPGPIHPFHLTVFGSFFFSNHYSVEEDFFQPLIFRSFPHDVEFSL